MHEVVDSYGIHVAYILTLFAFLTRNALWLRALFIAAQVLVITYALDRAIYPIAGWNSVFLIVNVVWVAILLKERRRVTLAPELAVLHARHFAALSPREFRRWWHQGHREVIRDAVMARAGERPTSLYFVLSGVVRVTNEESGHIIDLPPGFFVAEMSLLTGELPTATATAVGVVEIIRWPAADLRRLAERSPGEWAKIQSVLGHDIVEKLKRGAPSQTRQSAAGTLIGAEQ
jgi:CRP-like cAMP-binding protein